MLSVRVNPKEVGEIVSRVFSQMMLIDGFVHCDPHPGNLLVTWKEGRPGLVVLDHALYRRLAPRFRGALQRLWTGALLGDAEILVHSAEELFNRHDRKHGGENDPNLQRSARHLVELITHVPFEVLTDPNLRPDDRLALLEGSHQHHHEGNWAATGKEDVDLALAREIGNFAGRLRELDGLGVDGCGGDLFFTLKTLACLRATNRTMGVSDNVAMSGMTLALARARISEHWLVRLMCWPDSEPHLRKGISSETLQASHSLSSSRPSPTPAVETDEKSSFLSLSALTTSTIGVRWSEAMQRLACRVWIAWFRIHMYTRYYLGSLSSA
mmetsp:Transcript_13013/g.31883  ORF Transcript_13013/g.31883 Transcript_13013/m.31883 type:complete len:326 (-) Transcript_13013:182-1159(-)